MLFISQANKLKLNPVDDNEKFLVTFNYCFQNGLEGNVAYVGDPDFS